MDINIDNYLRVNLYDMGLILISTFLVVIIVKVFFWNNVKLYLDKRQQFLADELKESQDTLSESKQLRLSYELQLKQANQEAQKIKDIAIAQAKERSKEILKEAKKHAELVKSSASLDVENQLKKAKMQMKQEMSEIAFTLANKVLEKEVDQSIYDQYIEDFIEEASEATWQA